MDDFYRCDIFGLGLLLCSILNGGVNITAGAKDALTNTGAPFDDLAVDAYIAQLCETPLGVLRECQKSLGLYNSQSNLAGDPKATALLEMCLQDVAVQRGSASEVVKSIEGWLAEDVVAQAATVHEMYVQYLCSLSNPSKNLKGVF
jgi:hypothetical protein